MNWKIKRFIIPINNKTLTSYSNSSKSMQKPSCIKICNKRTKYKTKPQIKDDFLDENNLLEASISTVDKIIML